MQLLPMASSPDGLISARDAVITKTPGWEVPPSLGLWGGGGRLCVRKVLGERGAERLSHCYDWSSLSPWRPIPGQR